MLRKLQLMTAVLLGTGCLGCAMCASPYDYCAATVGPNGQPTGGFMTRVGSVLGGDPNMPPIGVQVPTPAGMQPTPAAGVTRPASATMPIEDPEELEAGE